VQRALNGAIQIFIGSTLVAMVTKIRPFSTQIGANSSCTNAKAAEFAAKGGFGDGRFNGAIYIFSGPSLVAIGTKIGLFSHKIVYNSAVVLGPHWDLEGRVRNCHPGVLHSNRKSTQN